MSTGPDAAEAVEDPPPEGARAGTFESWQRGLAFLLLALSLLALFRSEAAHVRDDIVLIAPEEARAGQVVPVRAFVLRDVAATRGPTLGDARVHVRVSTLAGRVLATTTLAGHAALGLRGALALSSDVRGTLRIDAWEESSHDGHDGPASAGLRVSRALTIVEHVNTPRVERDALPLQRGAVGRVRREKGEPPDVFLPRVLGGVCVPEERCTLAVWVGAPAAAITLEPTLGLEIVREFPRDEQSGIVTAELRVHGPEAELTLRARRAGAIVASRGVRVPVALGRAHLSPITLDAAGVRSAVTLPPGRTRASAELFVDDAWVDSRDVLAARAELVFPPLTAGERVRIEVRGDAFGAEGAASRVTSRSSGVAGALALLGAEDAALRPRLEAWPDELARDPELVCQFVAALHEEAALALGAPAHARPALVAQLVQGQLRVRWAAAAALGCGALIAGAALLRRGLSASREAAAVLAEAEAPLARAARRREGLTVLLWALAVALAFVAAALLIVAKPLWF